MKIIFDDRVEEELFLGLLCPIDLAKENHCRTNDCKGCWQEAGVEMEVKAVE